MPIDKKTRRVRSGASAKVSPVSRKRIGVWSEMPPGSKWANEGVTRVLGFLIEGAAQRGDIRFEIVAPRGMQDTIEDDLQNLAATKNQDWIVHRFPEPGARSSRHRKREKSTKSPIAARWLVAMPSPLLAIVVTPLAVLLLPFAMLRATVKSEMSARRLRRQLYFVKASLLRPKEILDHAARFLSNLRVWPFGTMGRAVSAAIRGDISQAPDSTVEVFDLAAEIDAMIRYTNASVNVDGWIVLFPFYTGALRLKQSKAVIFPDALVYDFPSGWDSNVYWQANGHWPTWRAQSAKLLEGADTVITFSRHVAVRHGGGLFGLPMEKMRCIPLAPPDLLPYFPLLLKTGRLGNANSKTAAGNTLREFASKSGNSFLADLPFEETPYFVVATQDRPTKNIGLAAEALCRLVRERGLPLKMITTARFFWGETWTTLPSLVEREDLHRDVISFPDLPRDAHAALFHCAALTVHPSFFEGIVGALPFFESLSVGTPCIFALGPHTAELISQEPELARYAFDPYDLDGLVDLIVEVLANREAVIAHQMPIGDRLRQYTWGDAANLYADAAVGRQALSTSDAHNSVVKENAHKG